MCIATAFMVRPLIRFGRWTGKRPGSDREPHVDALMRYLSQAQMKQTDDLQSMSIDQLWSLHEVVTSPLDQKITNERALLEKRLRELRSGGSSPDSLKLETKQRRPYPKVRP